MSVAIKNRSREEIISAFRRAMERKREWEERAQEDFKRIRQERLQFSL